MSNQAFDERLAAHEAEVKARDERLAGIGFGPVLTIQEGGFLGVSLSAAPEFTTCQKCGASVRLGEHEQVSHDGEEVTIEKNIRLHLEFHEAINAP